MCAGRGVGVGSLFYDGECVVDGSHSAQVIMSFARSLTVSEMHPYSLEHGLPPKVRWRAIRIKIKIVNYDLCQGFYISFGIEVLTSIF